MNDYEALRDAATNEAYHGPVLCAGTRRALTALFREIDRRAQQKMRQRRAQRNRLQTNVVSVPAHYAAMHEIAQELGIDWSEWVDGVRDAPKPEGKL